MKIRIVSIASLTPDPDNARLHSERNLETIKASLREFGQRRPIVIDSTGRVLAGNGTFEAAKRLGWTQLEAVTIPGKWTAEQAKAYALADNRTAELAAWDGDLLAAQLEAIDQAGISPVVIGFKLPGLADLQQNPTREIDLDDFSFEHECPECGFEFDA